MQNPSDFWNYIKKLGPQKKQDIPLEVTIDGEPESDHSKVLNKWRHDFEGLLNDVSNDFDDHFKEETIKYSETSEDWKELNTDNLNADITIQEVNAAIRHAKNKNSPIKG